MKIYNSSYQTQYIHIHSPCCYMSCHEDDILHIKHSSQCTGVEMSYKTHAYMRETPTQRVLSLTYLLSHTPVYIRDGLDRHGDSYVILLINTTSK